VISPVTQPQIYLACDLAEGTERADFLLIFWILHVYGAGFVKK